MSRDTSGRRRQPAGAPKSTGGQFAADNQRVGATAHVSEARATVLAASEFRATPEELSEYIDRGTALTKAGPESAYIDSIEVQHGEIRARRYTPHGGDAEQLHRREGPAVVTTHTTERWHYGQRHHEHGVAAIAGSTGRYYLRGREYDRRGFYVMQQKRASSGVTDLIARLDDAVDAGEISTRTPEHEHGMIYSAGNMEVRDLGTDTLQIRFAGGCFDHPHDDATLNTSRIQAWLDEAGALESEAAQAAQGDLEDHRAYFQERGITIDED